jgi:hypothetical protein
VPATAKHLPHDAVQPRQGSDLQVALGEDKLDGCPPAQQHVCRHFEDADVELGLVVHA